MSDYSDFITTIAEWANRQDWSPQLVGSFVRDAETKLNAELRIDRMIQFDQSEITLRNVELPDDWLEMENTSNGGSALTENTDVAVNPTGPSPASAVITATPAGWLRNARLNSSGLSPPRRCDPPDG